MSNWRCHSSCSRRVNYEKEVREMQERTCKSIEKSLEFEKSGETLSVEICLENVSPLTSSETLESFLNTLYERAK